MGFLADFWLPILMSGVFVFVVSSIIHMVIQWHNADYAKLPDEAALLEGMRGAGVKPGHYVFPRAPSMKDMGTPEMIEKYNVGPVGYMTVMPDGPWNMGKSLGQWFAFSVLVGVFVAYVASFTSASGSAFRLTSTVAFMVYGLSALQDSIWKGIGWSVTAKFVADGLLFGLATGAAFAIF